MTAFLLVFLIISAALFWVLVIWAVCRAVKDGQRPVPAPPPWVAPQMRGGQQINPHAPPPVVVDDHGPSTPPHPGKDTP